MSRYGSRHFAETNGWKWPAFVLAYLFASRYVDCTALMCGRTVGAAGAYYLTDFPFHSGVGPPFIPTMPDARVRRNSACFGKSFGESALIVDCPRCGPGISPLVGGSATVVFTRSRASCPSCGMMAPIRDGVYETVNDVVQSFRAFGATREDVIRFSAIASAVRSGETSVATADAQVSELGTVFADAWRTFNTNSGGVGLLVAILAVLLTIYYQRGSTADAATLQDTTARQLEVQELILSELRKQSATDHALPQVNVGARPNRHERRKKKAGASPRASTR